MRSVWYGTCASVYNFENEMKILESVYEGTNVHLSLRHIWIVLNVNKDVCLICYYTRSYLKNRFDMAVFNGQHNASSIDGCNNNATFIPSLRKFVTFYQEIYFEVNTSL